MTTNEEVLIAIEARENASQKINRVRGALQGLKTDILQNAKSFLSITALIGGVGISASLLTMAMTKMIKGNIEMGRTTARLTTRLQLLGFSAEVAKGSIDVLRGALSRTSFQGIAELDDATLRLMGTLGRTNLIFLAPFAEKLVEMSGGSITLQQSINALTEGIEQGFSPALAALGIQGDTFSEQLEDITKKNDSFLDSLSNLEKTWRRLKVVMTPVIGLIKEVISAKLNEWLTAVTDAVEGLSDIWGFLNRAWAFGWRGVVRFFSTAVPTFFRDVLVMIISGWVTAVNWIRNNVPRMFVNAWNTIRGPFVRAVVGFFRSIGSIMSQLWSGALSRVTTLFQRFGPQVAVQGAIIIFRVLQAMRGAWNFLRRWWENTALGQFLSKIKDLVSDFRDVAGDLINALAQGIRSKFFEVTNAARDLALRTRDAFFNALGKLKPGSPSQAGIEVGQAFIQGMNKGLQTPIDNLGQTGSGTSPLNVGGGGGNRRGGASAQVPLVIKIGERTFAEIVLEVVGEQIRLREPGLGMG